MRRLEPPSAATWILERLTPTDRDESLAGDLLEDFRSGRSGGWYWRQTLAAFITLWIKYLGDRKPMVAFAVLWSMLAPAWVALAERIDHIPSVAEALYIHWPLAAAMWTALSTAFLWTGMLLYITAHVNFRKTLRRQSIGRAFVLAPIIFLPAYFGTFVVTNLLWYPGLGGFRVLTPLAEIVDVRVWADALRIPYLIALLMALWRVVPQSSFGSEPQLVVSAPVEFSAQSDSLLLASKLDPVMVSRFFALTVTAGLVNAMIASFLLCRLPEVHAPSIASLGVRAVLYVIAGTLAGIGGSRFYWGYMVSPFKENPPLRFSLFSLICASAWVWIPSMVLFGEQLSAASAFVAMASAFVFVSGLRSATRAVYAPASHPPSLWEYNQTDLFAESLYRPPLDLRGYGIAIALYAAGWALATHSNYSAALLLAFSAFVFAWERAALEDNTYDSRSEYKRSALRLAGVTLPAVLLTMWALIDGVAHRNHALAAQSANPPSTSDAKDTNHIDEGLSVSGYQSIILWPPPAKKQIVAPPPQHTELLAPGSMRPLVIRFDGPYWYYQTPNKRPGPTAHQAHATPLGVDIAANNFIPLVMEAHQNLGVEIPLARCGEIQVGVENGNNGASVAMAIILRDSAGPGKPELYLGQQTIVGTEPAQFASKAAPVEEILHFTVPHNARIRHFDEITVMFFTDPGHARVAPKIAVEQFELFPR
jgi:hypothetical protein